MKHSVLRLIGGTSPMVLVLIALWASGQTTFYNINFNDQPPYQLVATGAPPNHVSQIMFGSPMVVPSLGGLLDQPLSLDMTSNTPSFYYDQVRLAATLVLRRGKIYGSSTVL